MKRNIQNPLLESLMKQANLYGNPLFEQQTDKTVKNTQFVEFVNYLSETGRNMIQAYQSAIGTYPATKYKADYMDSMPDKISAIAKTVGTSTGDKTINIQLDLLLKAIKDELNGFLEGSKKDEGYAPYLLGWRNALQKGFNQYELAIKEIEKYVKSKEDLGQAKMDDKQFAALGDSLEKIAGSMREEVANLKIANQGVENSSYTFDDAREELLERFIETRMLVNFSKFSEVMNEGKGKERRKAKRQAKQIIEDCNNLKAQANSVAILIASRESYHGGETNKFKSSGMNVQFADVAKQMDSVIAQLEGKDKRDLVMMDMTELEDTYDKYETLFNDLKEKYDKQYQEEYSKIKSIDVVNTASPDVSKFIENANSFFNSLSTLSLEAQRQKTLADKEKLKASSNATGSTGSTGATGATGSTGPEISSKPVTATETKGKKNDDVKSFQEMVIAKYAKDKDMTSESVYKDLKAALDKGQGGLYGKRTKAMVTYLKGGLNIKDTDGSTITKELIDAINKDVVKNESVNFRSWNNLFEFDHEAARKATSSSSTSTSGGSKKSKSSSGGGGDVKKKEGNTGPKGSIPDDFKSIKDVVGDSLIKVSGTEVMWKSSDGGEFHFFKDGLFKYYWKSKDKWLKGTWEADDTNGYLAYTPSDRNDVYYGKRKRWKSVDDQEVAQKAEKAKAEQDRRNKLYADMMIAARDFCMYLGGATEEEEKAAKIIANRVTTKEAYDLFVKAFQYLGIERSYGPCNLNNYTTWKNWDPAKIHETTKDRPNYASLSTLVSNYFDNSQIALLNSYLPAGVSKF